MSAQRCEAGARQCHQAAIGSIGVAGAFGARAGWPHHDLAASGFGPRIWPHRSDICDMMRTISKFVAGPSGTSGYASARRAPHMSHSCADPHPRMGAFAVQVEMFSKRACDPRASRGGGWPNAAGDGPRASFGLRHHRKGWCWQLGRRRFQNLCLAPRCCDFGRQCMPLRKHSRSGAPLNISKSRRPSTQRRHFCCSALGGCHQAILATLG